MTTGVDKVETAVYTMVFNVASVESTLVLEVVVVLLIDVVDNRLPAVEWKRRTVSEVMRGGGGGGGGRWLRDHVAHHFLLSTASPKPGVSTTVSLNLTPLSSISTVVASMDTVCFTLSARKRRVCVKLPS